MRRKERRRRRKKKMRERRKDTNRRSVVVESVIPIHSSKIKGRQGDRIPTRKDLQ